MMDARAEAELPILTDVVELRASAGSTGLHPRVDVPAATEGGIHSAGELAALQADLVGRTLNLTDELLHNAAREMEAVMFERVVNRLRAALPEIVALALREHLSPRDD
jgi:hypothetical protein